MSDIEYLKKVVEARRKDTARERARNKPKPNENMDDDVPERLAFYDFWCDDCEMDFTVPAYKTSSFLDGHKISTIRGRCPECGQEAVRYATHRDQDKYYQKSRKIMIARNAYRLEMLQGQEYGFRTMYGNPDKDFIEKKMKEEQEIIEQERGIGLRGAGLETKEKLSRLYN